MVRRGYLHCDPQRRYRVGPAVMRLAGAFLAELDLPRIVEPAVTALASETHETVAFAVRAGREVLVVARCNWPTSLAYTIQIGDTASLVASASGRAILAALPEAERAGLDLAPPSTRAVAQAEACGIAFSWEELTIGVNTAAIAVRDATGGPAGALSLSVPTPRYEPRAFLSHCRRLAAAAAALSQRLGAAPLPPPRVAPSLLPDSPPLRRRPTRTAA
jgi:DNA-binding IclR family transcriptional regulator